MRMLVLVVLMLFLLLTCVITGLSVEAPLAPDHSLGPLRLFQLFGLEYALNDIADIISP